MFILKIPDKKVKSLKKKIFYIIVSALIVFYPLFNISDVFGGSDGHPSVTRTQTDILEKLEQTNLRDAQNNILLSIKEKEEPAEKDKVTLTLEKLDKGEVTYRSLFSDICIVGDSLMNGLEAYNILNSNNLITKVSASLYHLSDSKGKIVRMSPRVLILHYGLNMLETDSGQPARFISFYKKLLTELQAELPDTLIIVSGIFPVDGDKVKAKRFSRIDEYNTALRETCLEIGAEYLDNSLLAEKAKGCYAHDGIHLNESFYRDVWLRHILREKEIIL